MTLPATRYWGLRLMRCITLLCLMLGLFGLFTQISAQTVKKAKNSAALMDVDGAIGPAIYDFLHRGFQKAVTAGDKVIIIRMDTPGGLSKSMREIIKNILASPIPIITYVAPSGARAASAGTYILYASHIAAMAPGTNLGAATPVAIGTPGASDKKDKKQKATKSAGELKAINDAKAYIRSLAQLRGRNVKWAEEAVTKAETLSANEALKLNVINIVAKDVPDLLRQANGMKVIVQGNEETLQTTNLTVRQILPDWRSKFLAVITDPSVAYILLMIGFYGLFFEFANPGFIVPGVVGAICLLLALYAFQLLPINYAGLGLILLGLAFIVAEAFMPSFGALGIGGVISFVIGSILLLKTDVVGFGIPLSLIISVAIVTLLFFLVILQLAFRSHRRKAVSGQEGMLGQTGTIVKDNDRIWVRVRGELWKVKSSSVLTDKQTVKIVGIKDLVLIVEPENNHTIGE